MPTAKPNQPRLIPLLDRAFIDFDVDPDVPVTPGMIGGIHTPEGFKPLPKEANAFPYYVATVTAVGPGCVKLKPGMKIAIPRDRVEKFSIGEFIYWQITEKAASGIFDEPEGENQNPA